MSKLFLPASCKRTPVQMSGNERVCVLVHHTTGRILCFARDDPFASSFKDAGYMKIEINHAHEYDLWARRLRDQAKVESEAQDYAYLERENDTRKKLRKQLRDRLLVLPVGAHRQAVQSALDCLEVMEKRRKRYRETFMLNEGYEATVKGEDLVTDLMVGDKKK